MFNHHFLTFSITTILPIIPTLLSFIHIPVIAAETSSSTFFVNVDTKSLTPIRPDSRLTASAQLHPLSRNVTSALHTFSKRQSNGGTFVITGAQYGGNRPRLEIRDLYGRTDMWNMYILGLARFQNISQQDPLGYFQVGAIHGRPRTVWGGVQGVGNSKPGFCSHISNVFLTWHRPYLALYEQMLVQNAVTVASMYPPGPVQDRYMQAAQQLRAPFWDWALRPPGGNVVPDFMVSRTIQVVTPENVRYGTGSSYIMNPLYAYRFHPESPIPSNRARDPNGLFYYPYRLMRQTVRIPNRTRDPSAVNQDSRLVDAFNGALSTIRSRLYSVLTQYNNYARVSTSRWKNSGDDSGMVDSIESIHDTVHGTIGGQGGHMSVTDISAYDPTFWLHHVNIDRITLLWQKMHPQTYVEPMEQTSSSYWYNVGDTIDGFTGLSPFFSPRGGFWSSNDVRTSEVFNYYYPGIYEGVTVAAARQLANQLYGSRSARGVGESSISDSAAAVAGPSTLPSLSPIGATNPSAGSFNTSNSGTLINGNNGPADVDNESDTESSDSEGDGDNTTVNNSRLQKSVTPTSHRRTARHKVTPQVLSTETSVLFKRDYVANVRTPKNFPTSYTIYFFFTSPKSDDPQTWHSDPNLVGVQSVLAMSMDNISNLVDPLLIGGSIHLSESIRNYVGSDDMAYRMTGADVTEFLRRNLIWKIADNSAREISPSELPGLEVTVGSFSIKPPNSDIHLPRWSKRMVVHVDVTLEKPSGRQTAEIPRFKNETPQGRAAVWQGSALNSSSAAINSRYSVKSSEWRWNGMSWIAPLNILNS